MRNIQFKTLLYGNRLFISIAHHNSHFFFVEISTNVKPAASKSSKKEKKKKGDLVNSKLIFSVYMSSYTKFKWIISKKIYKSMRQMQTK